MHVGEKIRELLTKNRYKQIDLARYLGATPAYITKLLDTRLPSEESLGKIATFFNVDVSELIGNLETSQVEYIQEKTNLPHGIPFYDVDVMAGRGELPQAMTSNPDAVYFLPNFRDCTAIFPIYGDSMYPRYRSGDRVIVKEYPHFHEYIRFGEVYMIFTKNEERMIKIIRKSAKEFHVLLASFNPLYDPFEIPMSIITKMFLVKGKLSIDNE